MLRYELDVAGPADRLLAEGLPLLMPVLEELADGALLIGGLAVAAWLTARLVQMPVRVTRDVDLGIDRKALGLSSTTAFVADLLGANDFKPGYQGEAFRFVRRTQQGHSFLVDLLVAPGASRQTPPIIEPGLPTLAAPGLAYALHRGPVPLELTLRDESASQTFALRTVHLDAAFVLKAALVGVRTRPDRLTADTVDAVMLAGACSSDPDAIASLAQNRRRSDVRKALQWMATQLSSPRSAAARRVAGYFEEPQAADWAVSVAESFAAALDKASS